MQTVLKTHDLTKAYGNRLAVDHVNMAIPRGEIYGFIGMNGAGKTTLMRLILSLALPTEGSFELFDGIQDIQQRRRIGSLVEMPGFFKNCSARENLERFSLLSEGDPRRVDDILHMIGLADTGKKKAGQFSMGMKQRLGIGIALLGDPEFIVLDEPINGLDPAGIMEMRNLILKLNREYGISFLISSHLLDELAKVATRFGIISHGKLVEEITPSELGEKVGSRARFVVDEPEEAVAFLKEKLSPENVERKEFAVLVRIPQKETSAVNALLVGAGIHVNSIGWQNEGLEDYFIERMR